MSEALAGRIREQVQRDGPLPFSRYMDAALYDPDDGFYSGVGRAGRSGDFLTAPEVGPLFGELMANAIDDVWERLGRPDPFTVIDAGAGPGTLARSIRAATPNCRMAMRYRLVERSAAQRAQHHDLRDDHRFSSTDVLPDRITDAVVLANELLDNLPADLARHVGSTWHNLLVGLDPSDPGRLGFVTGDPVPADVSLPRAAPGADAPIAGAAREWVVDTLGRMQNAELLVLDYGDSTDALINRGAFLRTYRGHERGGHPLDEPGEVDITVDVPIDQLPPPDEDSSQTDFLAGFGLEALVDEGRRIWTERASIGDLASLKARSRIREAEALTDAAGMGSFRVLRWRTQTTG